VLGLVPDKVWEINPCAPKAELGNGSVKATLKNKLIGLVQVLMDLIF